MMLRRSSHLTRHLLVAIVVILPFGIAVHEGGHALAARLFGAEIAHINILGIQAYPGLAWAPSLSAGYMHWSGKLSETQQYWISFAGSAATWSVSAMALMAWLVRPTKKAGLWRTLHLSLICLWLDVVFHSLPAVGLPAYLFFGPAALTRSRSELYVSAVALGAPSTVVLSAVFAYPFITMALVAWRGTLGDRGRAKMAALFAGRWNVGTGRAQ